MTLVRIHADVLKSLAQQQRWLSEHQDDGWSERMRQDLDEALDVLARFPRIGQMAPPRERKTARATAIRRLPLRRAPFILWYAFDERGDEVWVLRLFHVRQQSRGRRPRRRAR